MFKYKIINELKNIDDYDWCNYYIAKPLDNVYDEVLIMPADENFYSDDYYMLFIKTETYRPILERYYSTEKISEKIKLMFEKYKIYRVVWTPDNTNIK